jgi:peptidoglycan LD-endopeptidase LytH
VLVAALAVAGACSATGPRNRSAGTDPNTAESTSGIGPSIAATTTTTAIATTTTATTPKTTATTAPVAVKHAFPVDGEASYAHEHHDYPASDIIANCGLTAVSPVDGVILHWRTEDGYDRKTDNPALRGGRSLAVLGDDGVRYYMAHFQSLDDGLGIGTRVSAGEPVAVVGRSGDAGSCHVHFGLSPNCPTPEWAVRRGAIWPWPYLDAWRAGQNTSPSTEITTWSAAHPSACEAAAAEPHAEDAV